MHGERGGRFRRLDQRSYGLPVRGRTGALGSGAIQRLYGGNMDTSEHISACSIQDLGDSLQISIRKGPHRPTTLWAVACIAVTLPWLLLIPPILSSEGGPGVIVVLVGLGLVLPVVAFICVPVLVWQLGGQETVILASSQLRAIRSTPRTTREWAFDLSAISAVRVMPTEHDLGRRWKYLRPATASTLHVGRIGVEYLGSVYRFGSGLTTDEASDIVAAIVRFREKLGQ